MSNKHDFLITAPVPRVIGTMAVPTIISMMVTSVYNLADTYFVSQLSTQATAAVGIVFTIMTVFQAIGFLFGHGSGNYIAIRLGAGDEQEAGRMAVSGYTYALASTLLLTLAGLCFIKPLCLALGCTATILPYAIEYMRMILWGAPFIVGSLVLNIQIRQQGNAAYAMIGIMSGALLNMVLDPLFIFTFGMGIRGAGLATLVSQAVSFFILFAMTFKGGNLRLKTSNISFHPRYFRNILAGGTPSLTRQGLGSLSTLLLNTSAATFGDAAVAAMTIVTRITFLVYSVVIGLGQGYQPLCGFCYGAKLYPRVIRGFWFCVTIGTFFLSVIALVCGIFSTDIIALFRDDEEVVRIGAETLRWQLLTFPLGAISVLSNMMMQSINKPIRANVLAAARRGLFFIPFLFILPAYYGLQGLETAQPVADLCTFIVTIPILAYTFRKFRQTEA